MSVLMSDHDPIILRLSECVQEFHPAMRFDKRTGLVLPDRKIVAGFIDMELRTIIMDEETENPLIESATRIASICDVSVNSKNNPPLSLTLMPDSPVSFTLVMKLSEHLVEGMDQILSGQ